MTKMAKCDGLVIQNVKKVVIGKELVWSLR